jgi:hypothetical protein
MKIRIRLLQNENGFLAETKTKQRFWVDKRGNEISVLANMKFPCYEIFCFGNVNTAFAFVSKVFVFTFFSAKM